ncbi:MAG: NfeD family protein [Planctomycetota bacterium]
MIALVRRTLPFLVLALASLAAGARTATQERAPSVTHVRVQGALDVGTLATLERALDTADERGDSHVVVEIDTPGGDIELMRQLARAIRAGAEARTIVAWVHDHAWSAGVLVSLACDRLYMTSQASIGSATPVTFGPDGVQALPEEGGVREKHMSALRSDFRAMAQRGMRSGALAEAMVDANVEARLVKIDGEPRVVTGKEWDDLRAAGDPPELLRTIARKGELVNLSASEAVELGFADGLAESFDELLEKIGAARAPVQRVERARSDDFVSWLDRLSTLLIIAGLTFAYLEFKAPGFGLPGILSVACFAALLVGRYLAGLADIPHIVAVALGAALIATEIFVLPGTLWLGIGGAVLVAGGLIAASLGPGFEFGNRLDQNVLLDSSFQLLLSASIAIVVALTISRFLPKTPVLRGLVLAPAPEPVGASPERIARARGRALTDLRPVGKIEIDGRVGELLEAQAVGGWIPAGASVRVVDESTGRLLVEALDGAPAGSESA